MTSASMALENPNTMDKLFNNTTITKNIDVKIDGIKINPEEIVSLEVRQNFHDFGLFGTLKIKDSFDIMNNGLINFNGVNRITVTITDYFETISKRTYRIVDARSNLNQERFKFLDFSFEDEITFILKNTYLSKGFNTRGLTALSEYFTHLGLDNVISQDVLDWVFSGDGATRKFIVPQNMSALEYFVDFLKQENIRIWQDRQGVYGSVVSPSKIQQETIQTDTGTNNVLYSNKTLNNDYTFKIHDYEEFKNRNMVSTELKPKERIYRYDYQKEIVNETSNLLDTFDDFRINGNKSLFESSDFDDLQQTTGERLNTQGYFETGKQKFDLFDAYFNNNQLIIAVPGNLKYSNIGKVVEVELKGNTLYSRSDIENDEYSTGKYFISKVNDRILGNKLINKLTLSRLDPVRPGALR